LIDIGPIFMIYGIENFEVEKLPYKGT